MNTKSAANTATPTEEDTLVRTGADRLLDDAMDLVRGKRIGILTNHTGRLSDGRHIVDAIIESGCAEITALFGPEHGIGGDTPDGNVVDHGTHPRYGIPVYSLYGKTHKPTPAMLDNIELILCDIQDVGARFYTFISTVALVLEAAAERDIPVLILDRPNPIRGLAFDGPIRTNSLRTFVAWMPIPVTHGMTIGELTRMWNNEGWLAHGIEAQLDILQMTGWKRSLWFDETGLPWIPPSPNMPKLSTAIIYPGLCFVEGTSLSEGRGTSHPFEVVGAPWVESRKVLRELERLAPAGVSLTADQFTPIEIPGVARKPKHEGELCRGISITITDRDLVQPVQLGIAVIAAFKSIHPREVVLRNRRFDILTGSKGVRLQLEAGAPLDEIVGAWKPELQQFGKRRSEYLIYA